MNRREFLRSALATACAAPFAQCGPTIAKSSSVEDIGLQLWTVRKQLAAEPESILEAIAGIGYTSVQCDLSTLETHKGTFRRLGLSARSLAVPGETIGADAAEVERIVGAMSEHGVTYVVAHSPDTYLNSTATAGRSKRDAAAFYVQFAENLRRWSNACRAVGMQLGFHAHSSEYEPLLDGSALDILTRTLSSEELLFEVDVLWVSMAGKDPVRVITEYGSRSRSLHLRDRRVGVADSYDTLALLESESDVSVPLGDGTLDIDGILQAASRVGAKEWFVEQDFFNGDPVEELRRSYEYVASAVSVQ